MWQRRREAAPILVLSRSVQPHEQRQGTLGLLMHFARHTLGFPAPEASTGAPQGDGRRRAGRAPTSAPQCASCGVWDTLWPQPSSLPCVMGRGVPTVPSGGSLCDEVTFTTVGCVHSAPNHSGRPCPSPCPCARGPGATPPLWGSHLS